MLNWSSNWEHKQSTINVDVEVMTVTFELFTRYGSDFVRWLHMSKTLLIFVFFRRLKHILWVEQSVPTENESAQTKIWTLKIKRLKLKVNLVSYRIHIPNAGRNYTFKWTKNICIGNKYEFDGFINFGAYFILIAGISMILCLWICVGDLSW